MTHILNKVIIWATDNYNSLAMVRQIAQGDVKFDFIIHGKANCTVRSKYIQNYVETGSYEDAYKYLMNHYKDEKAKPIILTSGDGIISFIDQHRNDFLTYFIVPGTTTSGLITRYNDKYEMTQLAQRHGIIVPKSKQIKWDSDISDMPYPLMIKPSHEKPGLHNEFKFKVCHTKKELKQVLQYVHHDSVFIAQEKIDKEKDLLVYGARMFDGRVILAGSLETERFATGQGSSYGQVHDAIPSCINVEGIKSFLSEIDYVGLFSFEYGLKDGIAYFFEVNLRNDGTSNFFFQSGANIPLAYVYSCAGVNYSEVSLHVTEDRWYMDEIYDRINVLQGNIEKKQWEREREKVTAFKFYDKSDLEPYIIEKRGSIIRMYRDLFFYRYRIYILWLFSKFGIKK